jgi:hypothetical protein
MARRPSWPCAGLELYDQNKYMPRFELYCFAVLVVFDSGIRSPTHAARKLHGRPAARYTCGQASPNIILIRLALCLNAPNAEDISSESIGDPFEKLPTRRCSVAESAAFGPASCTPGCLQITHSCFPAILVVCAAVHTTCTEAPDATASMESLDIRLACSSTFWERL